ncbi:MULTISPECIES: tyrosine-type recombinase/integrase [Bacillus cereus group]|uniref:tyrosine-type recombinase/integrase n=1 Tax=Bacillus cereus group TaxID=86661 RepID=UPI0022E4FDCB|nr:tyrosine-type recombinase/integrase [Bacillus cereus group sp. TH152-1LC]MDA1675096.1 tyrosine-type recombinase/integrase [Bacillus cereus group sp. TH152-1LC]
MSLALLHPEMSYERFLDEWIKEKRKEVVKSTLARYENRIDVHIKNQIGDFAIEEIDKDVLQDFVDEMEKKIPNQTSTIKDVFIVIRSSLERAKEVGIIPENPAEEVSVPKEKKQSEMVLWNKKQIKTYLDALYEHPSYLAMYLVLKEGLQQGEALGLQWENVSFHYKLAKIVKILSHDGKELMDKTEDHKRSSKVRKMKFSSETMAELKKRLKAQEESKIDNPLDLVVMTSNGTPIAPKNLLRVHYRYCEQLGLPRTSFVELRHSYALASIKRGMNPLKLTEKLGFNDMRYLKTYENYLTAKEKEKINELSRSNYGRSIFVENA